MKTIGSNCSTCGDQVCDTPADSNMGATGGYNPDLTNIMSYYTLLNHFTTGQSTRMKNSINSSSFLSQLISDNCAIPELTGSEKICNNSVKTYTLINGGSNVAWNWSSNLNRLSSNSSSITVQPISPSTNGSGFVEAVLPFQTLRKNIFIGKPRLISAKLATGELLSHSSPNMVCKNATINTNMVFEGTGAITWSKVSSSHTTTWGQQGNNLNFYLWAVNHTATFKATLNNECGTFTRNYTFNIKNCTGGGDPCNPTLKLASNPVKKEIEVNFIPGPCKSSTQTKEINEDFVKNSEAILYDLVGNQMALRTPAVGKINVESLKPGIYILIISIYDEKKIHRVIIN